MTFRRGVALPMALMLTVVVGLIAAVALNRFGVQSMTVDRQVRGYQAHHMGRGLQEAFGAWLDRVRAGGIADSIGDDGRAFDLTLPDGTMFRAYLRDGQGTLLADVLALPQNEAINAAAAYNALIDRHPAGVVEANIRHVGPAAVSINGASEPVLDAVVHGLLPGDQAGKLLRELLRARSEDDEVSREDLSTALGTANIEPTLRQAVTTMLATEPELWLASIDLLGRRGELLRRYEGYISLKQSVSLSQPNPFLTFDEVPIEYPPRTGSLRR